MSIAAAMSLWANEFAVCSILHMQMNLDANVAVNHISVVHGVSNDC